MKSIRHWLLAGAMVVATSSASALPSYKVTYVGGTFADINNHGTILGTIQTANGVEGILWNGQFGPNQHLSYLSPPPGSTAVTYYGLSDFNEIVGSYIDTNSSRTVGFIANGNAVQVLDKPGTTNFRVRGISPDGHYVVGTWLSESTFTSVGFLLDRHTGQLTEILPTAGMVNVGVHGVSNAGRVAGSMSGGTGLTGFTFHNGVYSEFNVPGEAATTLRGITDTGYLTGMVSAGPFSPQYGFISQGNEIKKFDAGVLVLGINDAGVAVGSGGFNVSVLLTPVPEPATVLLMLSGLGMLGIRRLHSRWAV